MFKTKIHVTLKDDVLDPQGKTVQNALAHMGYKDVSNMKIGKYIEFTIQENDENKANNTVKEMCQKVLTNPVIEKFDFYLERIK